jgi:hypothetical protein
MILTLPFPRRGLGATATSAPPGPGEVLRTTIPDTMEGIKREMHRMVMHVRQGVGDPVVVDAARMILLASTPKNKISELGALFNWAKAHFHYVNDPVNKEVLQTPARMVRQTQVPRQLLARILEPIYGMAANGVVDMGRRAAPMNGPLPKALGDCDEGASMMAALCGAVGILPRFRFGGDEDSLYHVWAQAHVPRSPDYGVHGDDTWVDMDITEPSYTLGEFAPFKRYAHMDIFEE